MLAIPDSRISLVSIHSGSQLTLKTIVRHAVAIYKSPDCGFDENYSPDNQPQSLFAVWFDRLSQWVRLISVLPAFQMS